MAVGGADGAGQEAIPAAGPWRYRPEIDGLRALAVGAVVVNHFHAGLMASGYLGVDIFFVISGMVITASLLAKPGRHLGDHLAGFYQRRLQRLVPALVVFVLPVALLLCLVNPTPADSLATGVAALFGLANLVLHQQATDYFGASSQLNAFTHTWSLGVEEQFYLLFPILLWYSLRRRPSARPLQGFLGVGLALALLLLGSKLLTGHLFLLVPGGMEGFLTAARSLWPALLIPLVALVKLPVPPRQQAIALLGVLSGLSLVGFLRLYPSHQASAFFLMPWRFWELGAGSMALLLTGPPRAVHPDAPPQSSEPAGDKANPPISLVLLLGLTLALFLPQAWGRAATPLVVALSVALIASLRPGSPAQRLLSLGPVVGLGKISYSLYLWHWGVLALSRWTIGIHPWTVPLQLLAMGGAAWLSYRWVEMPLRHASWARLRGGSIALGVGALVAAAVPLALLGRWGGALALDRLFPSPWSRGYLQGIQEFRQQSHIRNRVDARLLEEGLSRDRQGRPLQRPRLYVFGDSHANHYLKALQEALPGWGVGEAVVGWQCGYIAKADIPALTRQWMADCEQYPRLVDQFLKTQLQPEDVVLLAHRWKEKKANRHSAATLEHLAELVEARGARLLLIDDVPEISESNPLLCEKRPWRPFPAPGCFRRREEVEADQAPHDRITRALARRHRGVRAVQLRDLYCSEQECGPYRGALMLYQDSDHLSVAASRLGAARLAAILKSWQSWTASPAALPAPADREDGHHPARTGHGQPPPPG